MKHFVKVKTEFKTIGRGQNTRNILTVYPEFLASAKDIMKKGGKFYAVLDQKTGMWSTNISDLYKIIDQDLYAFADSHYEKTESGFYHDKKDNEVHFMTIEESSTKMLIEFNKWFNNLPPNYNYISLDSELTFLSDEVTPEMHRSKRLSYDLSDGSIDAYETIISTLYLPEDREKIEWAVGAVLAGDAKYIEKMVVLYGKKGTGKSTILDIIEEIFKGYWTIFVADELASKAHQFATAAFKDNPLVAIQDDGNLQKIDSPRINEIVSHKMTQINEKNKEQYAIKPNAMLFLATNDLVDIHDTNMGIARRLLDVYPSGKTISPEREFRRLKNQAMKFEVPAIANHCLNVYKTLGRDAFSGYEPKKMIDKTNYLRNFIFDNEELLKNEDPITRDVAYKWYVNYFEESGLGYPPKRIIFGDQLREYYDEYDKVKWIKGKTYRHVYSGFKGPNPKSISKVIKSDGWLNLNCTKSVFDEWCMDKGFPAQYANKYEKPVTKWENVKTTLSDIDTSKIHYINIPEEEHHIRIDFDLKDKNGNKSLDLSMKAANEFPPTYAEISKSGNGIHLHYFYDGNVSELNNLYSENIEIKTDIGNGGNRRKLTKCNDLPIATINSGLPLKGEKMVDFDNIKDERHLRNIIFKNLKKEIHPGTKPSVDFIYKILDDAYNSGMVYDVLDLKPDILAFANNSTNHAQYCVNLVHKMKFQSEQATYEKEPVKEEKDAPLVFYDVEIVPNLFHISWMYDRDDASIVRIDNPTAADVAKLCKFNLVGFNVRRYDNHTLYARMMGYGNEGLYDLSQRIVNGDKSAFFREAYNLSYTDVYDFANTKQGLKKWEIELGLPHKELGLPWDQPIPEDMWDIVGDYCDNDVRATRAVFHHLKEDWTARKILAIISGITVNDTTNSHTTRIIVGDEKNPQDYYIYTDLSTEFPGYEFDPDGIDQSKYTPGTKIVAGKSLYLGEDPGEGGYVYAEPGMHYNVALLDIASMHPTSARVLKIFGKFQERFNALIDARLAIKHKEFDKALEYLAFLNPDATEQLKEYLSDAGDTKAMAYALKIPINSVYGLTSAPFENKLKDPNNIDNIVAKRGALFMINLKHEVQKRGFTVAHIKTDSIKIPNATPEIIQFVMDYGKQYGYTFEHEATYKKMCLVNEAVYIAQYDNGEWTATGAEFQHPYIFKTLFSKEPIVYKDFCETKQVKKGELYLDMNENLPEDEHQMTFVGRVGSFVAIKPGSGGGILYRVQDEKNYAASGTKGYRWMESDTAKDFFKDDIYENLDMSYYDKLCKDAVKHINEFGDFDNFVNGSEDELSKIISVPEGTDDEVPFEEDFMNKPTN